MKLQLTLGLVLIAALASLASSTQTQAGPYNVSFDLKAPAEPAIVASVNSSADSVCHALSISLKNKTVASVGIISYNSWQDASFPEARVRKALMSALAETGEIQDPALEERTIDGNRSLVQSYFDPQLNTNVTMASYWKDGRAMEGFGIPVGKTKVEILSNLPRDENENLLRSLAVKLPPQPSNTSGLSAPQVPAASASASPSKAPASGPSARAAAGQTINLRFPGGKKVALDTEVRSGSRLIDRDCMKNYEDLGYTPEMIAFLGYCIS